MFCERDLCRLQPSYLGTSFDDPGRRADVPRVEDVASLRRVPSSPPIGPPGPSHKGRTNGLPQLRLGGVVEPRRPILKLITYPQPFPRQKSTRDNPSGLEKASGGQVVSHLSDVRPHRGGSGYPFTLDLKEVEARLAPRGMHELSNLVTRTGVDVLAPKQADELWATDLALCEHDACKRHLKRR